MINFKSHFIQLSFKGDVGSPNNIDDPADVEDESTVDELMQTKTIGLIRVKRNLFEHHNMQKNSSQETEQLEDASNSLIYNKSSMDIYVKPTSKDSEIDAMSSRCSSPLLIEHHPNDEQFENIVCSPSLIQYPNRLDEAENLDELDDDDDDDLFIEEANNDTLFKMITQNFENCETFTTGTDNDRVKRELLISSVGSLNQQYNDNDMVAKARQQLSDTTGSEMKVAIGGLYLRNPRGNQVRQYDVNALYSALNDVKNGHSIYRWAC